MEVCYSSVHSHKPAAVQAVPPTYVLGELAVGGCFQHWFCSDLISSYPSVQSVMVEGCKVQEPVRHRGVHKAISIETSLKNTTRGRCSLWLITLITDEVQQSSSSLWFASSWQHRETRCVLLLPALGLTAVTLSLFTERPQSADHAQPIWRRGVRERDRHLTSALQLCSRVPAPIVLLLVCLSISGVTGHLLPRKAPTSHHQFLTQPSSWLWKPKSWWRGCVLSQLIKVQSSLTQNKKPEHCVYTLRGNTMFGRKDKGSNCKQDNEHFQIMWWKLVFFCHGLRIDG